LLLTKTRNFVITDNQNFLDIFKFSTNNAYIKLKKKTISYKTHIYMEYFLARIDVK